MVGTATIALERYGPLARRPEVRRRRAELGLAEVPLAVTASRSLELPVDAPLFQDPESRIVVLTNSDREPPPCEAQLIVERIPGDGARPRRGRGAAALGATACARCCTRADPRCWRRCSPPGLVDELFLTVSPMLVGGGEPSVVEGIAFERPRALELLSVPRARELPVPALRDRRVVAHGSEQLVDRRVVGRVLVVVRVQHASLG